MRAFGTIEEAVESFLDDVRSGSSVGAREFSSRHAYLGDELLDALEALEILEVARVPVAARALGGGARFGPYAIVREIGRGGMGVVFEAIEAPLGRRVALKCLPPELLSRRSARARFEREAEIASKLDHPGICTVYGAGVTDAQPWIAMRFVEGETLAERIAEARARGDRWLALPGSGDEARTRVLAIARCVALVARALAEAHAHGFVHRDVKPSNVMITPSGEPVLLDFGLATATDAETTLTRTGDLPGTPMYLAPELIAGGSPEPDARCDVYSLGVLLHECLALVPPFSGPTREALYRSILDGPTPRVAPREPAVPRDLEVVVATALERDRSRRYAGAAELASDLERVVAGVPIQARPISSLGRVARWAKREPRQAALSVGLAIAALGLAVVGGVYWASRDAVRAAETMVRAREIEHRLVEGFRALDADDHAGADAAFDDVLARDAQNVEALAGRVLVSIDRHDERGARERLERAPRTPVFDDLRALTDGRDRVEHEPDWLERADAFQLFVSGMRLRRGMNGTPRSERAAVAKRAYDRLTEAVLRSSTPRALYHAERAFAAGGTGDADAARSSAASLLALWPDEPTEVFAAAVALLDVDRPRARELLEHVTRSTPEFRPGWTLLAQSRYRASDVDGALAAARRAIELDPKSSESHSTAARCYTDLGCADEARAEFARATTLRPNAFEYWANWAQLECNEKDFERATELLALAIAVDARQPQAHWWRGFALGRIGRWAEAREHFEVAAALAPDKPAMWQGLLSATVALDDVESTRLVLDRALELQPREPELLRLKRDLDRR